MHLTGHARKRLQQRALPPFVIHLLYSFGVEKRQNGATLIFFNEKARKKAREELEDALRRFDKIGDAFLVESADDGRVITVGHHYRRIHGS